MAVLSPPCEAVMVLALMTPSRALEPGGRRTLEKDPPAARVDEAESRGVQADASQRVAPAPVRAAADDRIPERGGLGAGLTRPPRHEHKLEHRRAPGALEHAVAGDRFLAAASVAREPNAQGAVLDEGPGQRALRAADDALHAGHVDTLGRAPAKLRLERLLHRERPGEDEQTGGLTVEPMDDEDPPASPCPHPVAEEAVRGALTLGFGGDRQVGCGLVGDHEGGVLVHEAERSGEAGGAR